MFQIPWQLYTEEEIHEIVSELYRRRGYEVYNIHQVDRRGEEGVDLECARPGESDKILISVKKKPGKKDIGQLNSLASKTARTKIYVHIAEPSTTFKKAMEKVANKVSFWDSRKLTYETYTTDLRFYLFMVIENHFEKDIFAIALLLCQFYIDFEEKGTRFEKPVKADNRMINLLWQAKDRSASLHKSLRTLQTLFEQMKSIEIEERTKESITQAFLKSLSQLQLDSLRPLKRLFREFLHKYPANFERFCVESKGASNWKYLTRMTPELSPGYIMKSLREAREMVQKYTSKTDLPSDEGKSSEVLGDVSRFLANEAYWLEDTVDNLLKIGLTGKAR